MSERYKRLKKDPEWYKKESKRKLILAREYWNKKGRESALRFKMIIIKKYGEKCLCCGIKEQEFLAVDHINGNGNKHRKENNIKGGRHFYDWLRRNNYPPGFQILCHNCNFAKSHYSYGCPHKNKEGDYTPP